MPLFNNFFPAHVVTYTSDRTVDFALGDNQNTLSNKQKGFLLAQLNSNLPEPVHIRQIHSNKVIMTDKGFSELREADGLLTKTPQLPLAIRSADCLPVFLYDHRQEGIGLLHVGWKGSRDNIIARAVKLMGEQWLSDPKDIQVVFGPAIRSCCYEVGKEFREYFPDDLTVKEGRYYLDLPKINQDRLTDSGISAGNIFDCGICSCCDQNYFSYRRDGDVTGRMISLIVINKNEGD